MLAHELATSSPTYSCRRLWLKSLPEQRDAIHRALRMAGIRPLFGDKRTTKGLPDRPQAIMGRGLQLPVRRLTGRYMADLIARELLAPWEKVAAQYVPGDGNRPHMIRLLREQYGLPLRIAAYYCSDLQRCLTPKPDLDGPAVCATAGH